MGVIGKGERRIAGAHASHSVKVEEGLSVVPVPVSIATRPLVTTSSAGASSAATGTLQMRAALGASKGATASRNCSMLAVCAVSAR